jgi:hypothetical protein
MTMILTTKWPYFFDQINGYITQGRIILNKENTATESDIEKITTEIKDWKDSCSEYLKKSLNDNKMSHEFYYLKEQRYNLGNRQKDFTQIKKELFEDLKAKVEYLNYNLRIFSISDAITKPDILNLNNRNSFTTEEILELILDKLYSLYDNFYHPIQIIMEGNGISIKRHGEDRELGQILEEKGFVSLNQFGESSSAKLTLKGKIYIEEKRKIFKENYEDINKSKEEIDERVNEVIEKLTKLGYGQEIIFEEIQELKELYATLSKKNWGQIVKGKLVDLSLAKLIENDTLKYIYEKLTDHTLHLP